MKNIFYILLLLPTIIFAQYPSNSGQKITLGEQTTADGLVYRGLVADTTRKPSVDTMAYIILDTTTNLIWHYKKGTSNAWLQAGGGVSVTSFSAGTTGLTPSTATTGAVTLGGTLAVANGGTGSATQNFVDLTTAQTVGGQKTFTSTLNLTNADGLNINNTNGKIVGGGTTTGRFFFTNTDLSSYFVIYGGAHATSPFDITYVTNTNNIFQFNNDGNFGIGTTSPVANLQINSSTTTPTMAFSQSFSNTSAQRGGFAFYNSGISTVASIIAQAVTDNVGTDLEFYTRPVGGLLTKNMVILNNGNVGIGTTSPTARLHVKGSTPDGTASAFKIDNSGNTNLLNILNNGVATFSSSVQTGGDISIVNGAGAGKKIFMLGNTAQVNWMIAAQQNVNNALEITPSTAAGGSTFSTPAIVIASDGKVGIGTVSPDEPLHVVKSTSTTNSITEVIHVQAKTTGTLASGFGPSIGFWGALTGGNNVELGQIGAVNTNINGANGDLVFYTRPNAPIVERMRITSAGEVLVGTTILDVNTQGIQLRNNGIGIFVRSGASCLQLNRLTNDGIIASFRTSDVERGSISISGSNTTYNTTSDYRLKYDFKDYSGLDIVSKIKSYDFAWKEDNKRMYGVIAHELQEILEYTVVGEKDGVDMQGVDYSKLTPILVKAVQELSAQIDILKQEIVKDTVSIQEQNEIIKALEQRIINIETN